MDELGGGVNLSQEVVSSEGLIAFGPCVLVLDGVDELGGGVNLSQEVVSSEGLIALGPCSFVGQIIT